jgi:hypothetical protein
VVLGLSQDGACTDLFENFSENSLKGDPSNNSTLNPPLFLLANTFNIVEIIAYKFKFTVTVTMSQIQDNHGFRQLKGISL